MFILKPEKGAYPENSHVVFCRNIESHDDVGLYVLGCRVDILGTWLYSVLFNLKEKKKKSTRGASGSCFRTLQVILVSNT